MSKNSEAVKTWRQRTKEKIVVSMGGKCVLCEYSKCMSALELHHLDPSKKSFSFGGIRANPKAWNLIVEELKKCILICSNCHREVESKLVDVSQLQSSFDETKLDISSMKTYDKTIWFTRNCISCNVKYDGYHKNQKFCSVVCRQSNIVNKIRTKSTQIKNQVKTERKTKINWPPIGWIIQCTKERGYVATAKLLGVSDNAVRKRIKKYSDVVQWRN